MKVSLKTHLSAQVESVTEMPPSVAADVSLVDLFNISEHQIIKASRAEVQIHIHPSEMLAAAPDTALIKADKKQTV